MPTSNLNIVVLEKRMLNQSEASAYLGLSHNDFKTICTIRPVEWKPGKYRWDKHDLDKLIDSSKMGDRQVSVSALLERLS